jgi:hypothetical protein
VASLKERDDILYFMRGERLYGVGSEEEADCFGIFAPGLSLV